jgi:hypothetical protein
LKNTQKVLREGALSASLGARHPSCGLERIDGIEPARMCCLWWLMRIATPLLKRGILSQAAIPDFL